MTTATSLPGDFPLAPGRPFTTTQARAAGVQRWNLQRLVERGALRRLLPSVYVGALEADTWDLRLSALRLVVPPDAVVTDETAGWLHGAPMVLAPGSHEVTPPVSAFQATRGLRLRNRLAASGERRLAPGDVQDVGGLLVTTPLRTACDLGRLRHRDRAIAALDSMLRLGSFSKEDLLLELDRFKGYRGIVQLRWLAPLADPRAESPPESTLRLRWITAGLPAPEPQLVVPGPFGWSYRFDLAVERFRYAAEYDGEEFHSTPEQRLHDERRRTWLRDEGGWTITVVRRAGLYGVRQTCSECLVRDFHRARARCAA